ncbi:MAG: hypothetical protein IKI30_03775 [Oxalobacter sp.]|nr:hypothetical protein [Oxalobacter sp.]
MLDRVFYNNPRLSEDQLIQAFSDAWGLADTTLIDELDCRSTGGRKVVDMSFKDFVHWLRRCSTFRAFSFIDGKAYVDGERMFTAFVRFADPVVDRDLSGWAHVPFNKAQPLIQRYGLMRR